MSRKENLLLKIFQINNKIYIFLLLILFIPSFHVYSQDIQSTDTYENIPLSKVLDKVSKKHKVKVAFDADKFNLLEISIKYSDNKVEDIFDLICKKYPIKYQLISGTYVFYEIEKEFNAIVQETIKKKEEQKAIEKEKEETPPPPVIEKNIPRRIWVDLFLNDRSSGKPINNCVVRINGLQYKTDKNGFFPFRHSTQRPVKLVANTVGYEKFDTTMVNSLDTIIHISLKPIVRIKDENLQSLSSLGDTVQLTTDEKMLIEIVAPKEIHNEIDIIPQTINIPLQTNGFSLMGATLHESNYFQDGAQHYQHEYLNGVISRFNEKYIKTETLFQGGNGANIGGTLPATIVMESADIHKKTNIGISINPFSSNASIGIPITSKLSFTGMFRRSNIDLFNSEFAEKINDEQFFDQNRNRINTTTQKDLKFTDYNANLTYLKSQNNEITFNFTLGNDHEKYNYDFPQQSAFRVKNQNETSHWGVSFNTKFQHQPNRINIITASTYTLKELANKDIEGNQEYNTFATIDQNLIQSQLRQHRFEWKSNWKLETSQHQFGAGISISDFEIEAGNFKPPFILDFNNIKTNTLIMPAYAYYQGTFTLFSLINLRGGIRANLGDEFSAPVLLPRFSASIDGKFVNLYYKMGQYLQYVKRINKIDWNGSRNYVLFTPNKNKAEVPYSEQHIIGAQVNYKGFNLHIEAFSHEITNNTLIWDKIDDNNVISTILDNGTQYYKGLNVWNAIKLNNWNHEINYLLSETTEKYEQFNNGKTFTGFNNFTHRIQITESYKLKNWTASMFWNFRSGANYMRNEAHNGILIFNQLDDFSQLNFSILYNLQLKNTLITAGVSALNILDNSNTIDTYNYSLSNNTEIHQLTAFRKGLPFTPFMFLEINFQ